MLLRSVLEDFKGSKYMQTKDAGVEITIKVDGDNVAAGAPIETPIEQPSNTDGVVYNGYTIKQDGEGQFNIFSVGGALVGTLPTMEEAMARVNSIAVDIK